MQEFSLCTLEQHLATAYDVACARAASLGSSEADETPFQHVSGGLPSLLVSVLSRTYHLWQKFYHCMNNTNKSAAEIELVTECSQQTFHLSDEVKEMQRVLNLLAKVSKLDSTLGEEISRAGSQAILSRLVEQIKVCLSILESSDTFEEEFDALMDLQDTAYELYFPGIQGALAFTDEELISRLPLVYNLVPASIEDGEFCSKTVLIHQVTKRQTAQADVGYLMWPSAIALSRWLLSNTHTLKGKTILEIGAGCGLVGILAAAIVKDCNKPDQKVIISDINKLVLDNIARNIILNDVKDVASVIKLDFYRQTGKHYSGKWIAGEYGGNDEREYGPVDVILAADIICQPEDATAAAKTIYDALIPGGVAYVVCANEKHRFGVGKFASECEALNLYVKQTNVKDIYSGALLTDCMDTAAGFVDDMTMLFFNVVKSKSEAL